MTEARTVHGHLLSPFGMVAGRTVYRFTSHGDVYLLTPDVPATYLLQRPADGYAGLFGTVEEAVGYIETLEAGEAVAPRRAPGAAGFARRRTAAR